MRVVGTLACCLAVAIPVGGTIAAPAPEPCVVPADLARLDLPLSRTARRLAGNDPLTIVALGSSSTAGAGASTPAAAYPSRLAAEMARRFPSRPIDVLNRGVNGELIIDMLARLDSSVIAEHPDLVLWQVGTNAVLHHSEPVQATALISQGLQRLKAVGADIVVIDPQYAPKVIADPGAERIVELISVAARRQDVNLFRRFALMRYWRDVEGRPFESLISPDGLHMNDWSYACFAEALATAIADAVGRSPQPP